MKMLLSSFRFLSIAAAVVIVFASCKKSVLDDQNQNQEVAGLMAFNLVPDVNSMSMVLSGSNITPSPLAYTNFTGTYLRIFPGNRALEAYEGFSGNSLTSVNGNFVPGKYYSAFVAGANDTYRAFITEDNFDSLSGSGSAYVRFVNGIPDSSVTTVTIASNGSNVINDQASFTNVSEFAAVSPGDIQITISNGAGINATRTINVMERKVYTVLLVGTPGSTDTPVEIKFITNGELEQTDGERIQNEGRTTPVN